MDNAVSETIALLSLVVRAMVTDREAVRIQLLREQNGQLTFQVRVANGEIGKLIGKGGQIARSLRLVVHAIGKEQGCHYGVELIEPTPLHA